MHIIDKASQSEELGSQVEDCEGAYIVPAFTGLGAPYWSQHTRGVIVGLTRGFNNKHLARATLESIAYQTHDIVKAMEEDANIKLKELKVDGGACANDLLLSFQADILNASVYRPSCIETTALGAAYLAGLAIDYYSNLDEIRANWSIDKIFEPKMSEIKRIEKLNGWKKAINTALYWSKD